MDLGLTETALLDDTRDHKIKWGHASVSYGATEILLDQFKVFFARKTVLHESSVNPPPETPP